MRSKRSLTEACFHDPPVSLVFFVCCCFFFKGRGFFFSIWQRRVNRKKNQTNETKTAQVQWPTRADGKERKTKQMTTKRKQRRGGGEPKETPKGRGPPGPRRPRPFPPSSTALCPSLASLRETKRKDETRKRMRRKRRGRSLFFGRKKNVPVPGKTALCSRT